MRNRFQISKINDEYHFVLKAGNGETILSSEMYKQKASAIKGIEAVKRESKNYSSFDMRKSIDKEDYFVLKARNGEIIGVSEMYSSKQAMLNGIDSVIENSVDAPIYEAGIDPYKEEE